jgi:hypothetical protein
MTRTPVLNLVALLAAMTIVGCDSLITRPAPDVQVIETPVLNSTSCDPFPACARALTSSEETDVDNGIAAISCEPIQSFLQNLRDDGRILGYTSEDSDDRGVINFQGTDSVAIGLGTANWQMFTIVSTMRHEFGHDHLVRLGDIVHTEEDADWYMTNCPHDGFLN